MVILFGAMAWIEFGVLRAKFKNLYEKQLQTELAQGSALTSRDFALQLQQFLQGRKELLSNITSLADRQDEQLLLLSIGGKMESSSEMIKPLSPISKITLEQLDKAWRNYKKSAITMATHEVWKDSVVAQPAAEGIDSLSESISPEVIKTLNPNVIEARTLLDGQWATLTIKYNELIKY